MPSNDVTFVELPGIDEGNPLDAWSFDGALFVSTGARTGGTSRIFRHEDPLGDGHWVAENVPSDAETINKLRDDGDTLYAFYETPPEGQTWLTGLAKGETQWVFESLPNIGSTVGGRGLAIGPGGTRVAGASHNWESTRDGQTYVYAGGYEARRDIGPSLMWELEYDEFGRLWEFWNDFGGTGIPATFVAGAQASDPPGGDISSANWFPVSEHMYTVGALAGTPTRNVINRSRHGEPWEEVHRFAEATLGDHVLFVPRNRGELWAVGHHPLEVSWTLDGTTWTREMSIPAISTGVDTNHLTAIAFHEGRVWVFSRDDALGRIRVWQEWARDFRALRRLGRAMEGRP